MRSPVETARRIRWRGQDERGAVLVLASIALVTMVAAAALSVDIGATASRKRDVRKVSDLAALDATTRLADIVASASPSAAAHEAVQASAARNGLDLDPAEPRTAVFAVLGTYETGTFTACGAPLGVEVIDDATADAAILTGVCEPNAVRAASADVAPRYFAFFAEDRVVGADAIAARPRWSSTSDHLGTEGTPGTRDNVATISAGSFVARATFATNPLLPEVLRGLLGNTSAVGSFDAVSYQGLAASEISLEVLRQALVANGTASAGTVDELLDTEVSLASLYSAAADANLLHGGSSAVSADLDSLASLAAASTTTAGFRFGDLVDVELGQPDTTGAAQLNVLDMVTAAAQIANGTNLFDIELAATDLPAGIASGTVKATVIELPMMATGPVGTKVTTSQVRLQLDLVLADTVTVLPLTTSQVRLPVVVDAGTATAEITNVFNPDAFDESQQQVDVFTRTAAGYAGIGLLADTELRNPLPASLPQVDMLLSALATTTSVEREEAVAECEAEVAFVHPFDPANPGYTRTAGCDAFALAGPLVDPVTGVLESLLGTVVADTNAVIGDALGPVNDLVDQLTAGFGITVGGADVTIHDVKAVTTTGSPPVPGSPGPTVTGDSGAILVK
ncbi:MAG: hypothetical protein KY458_13760 [Actinobacteria bacterium]|nr:hypothetical protein [Actinomycetota bacterium]